MSITPDEARAFMRTHHHALLAALRRDGQPQLSPILVGIDEDGAMIVSRREPAFKTANIRRTGWASVVRDAARGAGAAADPTGASRTHTFGLSPLGCQCCSISHVARLPTSAFSLKE
jgi:hypothetical protein